MERRHLLRLLLGLACVPQLSRAGAGEPLAMAVYPYRPAVEIQNHFAPLLKLLSGAVDRPISLRIGRDYDEHMRMVIEEGVDLAYIGAAGYLALTRQASDLSLLCRMEIEGRAELGGHIVVRKDSPLKSLADLRGRRMAFTDKNSTMGYLVPRAILARAGIREKDFLAQRFFGSNENVAMAVMSGDFDAGAMRADAFDAYVAAGLRSLHELPRFSEHVFVATRRLARPLQEAMRGAMLGLADTAAGRDVLRKIRNNATALVPGKPADFDGLRQMLASA